MPGRIAIAVLGAVGLVACISSQGDLADYEPDPSPEDMGEAPQCTVDSQCTAAGPSCCECPTYAVPVSSGWDDNCEDVCDSPMSCPAAPACRDNRCVLRCVEQTCDGATQCDGGFAVDELGCLSCECAPSAPPATEECELDTDCVRVAADCCGCARGGVDTAVPTSEVDNFDSSLGCDDGATCPDVDICDPDSVPRCINGSCQLALANGDPDVPDGGVGLQLCGSPDFPPCPSGYACVVNDPQAGPANQSGLGVCRSQ